VQNNVDDDDDESSLSSWTLSDDCDEYLSLGSGLKSFTFKVLFNDIHPFRALAGPCTLSKHFIKALYPSTLSKHLKHLPAR